MRVMSWMRPSPGLDLSHCLFYLTLLLWTRRLSGLADFSNYLSRIITSHSAHACDGQPLRLHCPRHSTISIQSAFYGSGEVWACRPDPDPPLGAHNHSCSAFTALQKLLSECQSHRDCQLPVNHLLFGKDPCPGTSKYLHVDYRCKPKCLNHEAVHSVSKSCHGKQKCAVAVSNQTFRDPCFPGTRKYLSVIYSCVPQSLLREADPDVFNSTSSPPVETEKASPVDLDELLAKGSRRPGNTGAVMSTSLLTYTYIREHPEMAALLFTSSVCVGLLLTLLAVSVRVTCRGRQLRDNALQTRSCSQTVKHQVEEEEEEDEDEEDEDDDEGTESSLISTTERKVVCDWEEVTYVSEEADRAERIERRDMVIQEISMNAYLNGSSC